LLDASIIVEGDERDFLINSGFGAFKTAEAEADEMAKPSVLARPEIKRVVDVSGIDRESGPSLSL
jgi:hypothetical protein